MQIRQLVDALSVATQLDASDMSTVAALGFRSVINNRPDNEEAGQPAGASLEQAALAAGLAYREIAVVSGQITPAQAQSFGQTLAHLPAPVLAFCRTGTRSTLLWALDSARSGTDIDAIIGTAAHAGYDLGGWRARLQQAQHGDVAAT
ncbi:TIGR01244 family sulfur transferase [Dyella silvatica]|uniref:TIGR01244 family sulfur transferase n=1 Tax=Dyella silvatica TaxID=2992128 RepID=UPI002258195D|nr:TIGR01244 family sulfur transferase [Dyella silvatica]